MGFVDSISQSTVGPPGSGKSTAAAMLGRDHGYIYYEGDCIFSSCNPYVDPTSEEPSIAQANQIAMKVIEILTIFL